MSLDSFPVNWYEDKDKDKDKDKKDKKERQTPCTSPTCRCIARTTS